jgi:hypothetical protein
VDQSDEPRPVRPDAGLGSRQNGEHKTKGCAFLSSGEPDCHALSFLRPNPTLFPATGSCPDKLPLTKEELEKIRAVAGQLAAIRQKAAEETGSALVKASDLTKGHDVCSADPWVYGFEFFRSLTGFNPVPCHPKLETM